MRIRQPKNPSAVEKGRFRTMSLFDAITCSDEEFVVPPDSVTAALFAQNKHENDVSHQLHQPVPNSLNACLTKIEGFESAKPADEQNGFPQSDHNREAEGDRKIFSNFANCRLTEYAILGSSRNRNNSSGCMQLAMNDGRPGLDPRAEPPSSLLLGDHHHVTQEISAPFTAPASPDDAPHAGAAVAAGPHSLDPGDAEVSRGLAAVPAVRPADVSPLAAAYGVATLPESLRPFGEPGHTGKLDVELAERDAFALRYPTVDSALLGRIVGTRSKGTYRVYAYDAGAIVRFATGMGVAAFPATPALLAAFGFKLMDDGLPHRRIKRIIASIAAVHTLLGVASPNGDRLVHDMFGAVARATGSRGERKRSPFRPTELRQALVYLDRLAETEPEHAALVLAVLSLGIATGLRALELVSLDTNDVEVTRQGLRIRVGKTKTRSANDPPAYIDVGRVYDTRICPVRAIMRYVEICRVDQGPLFRSTMPDGTLRRSRMNKATVSDIVRRVVQRSGICADPHKGAWSSHSLRTGFVTAAFEAGLSVDEIMATSLHEDKRTMFGYIVQNGSDARTTTAAVFA